MKPDDAADAPSFDPASLLDEARGQLADAVQLRRDLHVWPEVGNDLPRTRDRVLEALDGLPLDIVRHRSTSGFTALLTGDRPGPTILLRADMDALPMPEESGVEFASKVAGAMHACGHDTHVAMLTGAAHMLCDRRGELAGRVLFMYQPGEEGHHGARYMLDEGMLDVPDLPDGSPSPVARAFALHITSSLPTGWIASRGGPALASADTLTIDVVGRGGHASEPYRTRDPIPVACEIVQALQTMVTRTVNVFEPAVVTVASISAGTTNNVIPDDARIVGTIRAVSESTRSTVHAHTKRVAEGVASAHGLHASVTIEGGYPVTVNDRDDVTRVLDVARRVAGRQQVVEMPNPVMGAEDFSYVLQRIPGSMAFLGGTPLDGDPVTAAPNHSTKVVFDEQAMVTGIATYAAVALDALG